MKKTIRSIRFSPHDRIDPQVPLNETNRGYPAAESFLSKVDHKSGFGSQLESPGHVIDFAIDLSRTSARKLTADAFVRHTTGVRVVPDPDPNLFSLFLQLAESMESVCRFWPSMPRQMNSFVELDTQTRRSAFVFRKWTCLLFANRRDAWTCYVRGNLAVVLSCTFRSNCSTLCILYSNSYIESHSMFLNCQKRKINWKIV